MPFWKNLTNLVQDITGVNWGVVYGKWDQSSSIDHHFFLGGGGDVILIFPEITTPRHSPFLVGHF